MKKKRRKINSLQASLIILKYFCKIYKKHKQLLNQGLLSFLSQLASSQCLNNFNLSYILSYISALICNLVCRIFSKKGIFQEN